MAEYAVVKDNQVTARWDNLPKAWEHVSGLHLLKDDEETLNSLGIYSVQKVYIHCDQHTQYIETYEYSFTDNKVYETPVVKDYPPVTITPEELFNAALNALRIERDIRIANSDWTQLTDVQSIHDDEWKTNWANYRQALRDLPNQCISGEINIYDFIWPIEPN